MKKMRIALAGNANVGKSVIFNHLTKLHQHIGNWPGKTVEKAEGTFRFKDYVIDVIDLPGIYSLSTFSLEEIIAREYIVKEKPDVVINVVDASVLERNLFLTLQLIEIGAPLVIALNQVDMAEKKGIRIDYRKLEKLLGVPVVPTIATKGVGIYEVAEKAIKMFEKVKKPKKIVYGKEIEKNLRKLEKIARKSETGYPPRWVAVKLLEKDREVRGLASSNKQLLYEARKAEKGIEKIHGHSCPTAITCEKYSVISSIAKDVQKPVKKRKSHSKMLHSIITHRVWGYPIMIAVVLLMFFAIFTFGDFLSGLIEGGFAGAIGMLETIVGGDVVLHFITGLLEGVIAGLTVVIPYILPFYLVLGILEDSGYLSRIAFLMDNFMHKIGLHGKAFIPIIMGYGCNVPACLSCRIMETERERLIAIFVTTLIPCAAVTTVILGLVARFVSIWWAIGLYVIDIAIVFALGRVAFRVLPGEPTGLIMEISPLRLPHVRTTLKQTWFRLKDFIYIAFPIIIASTLIIKIIKFAGMLEVINSLLNPVTVAWLGLPAVTGIALVFGILRKELTLIMLSALLGTTNFAGVLTPIQMLVFAFVTMLYIPCAATIAALVKETGWKRATFITVFEVLFAIMMGGMFLRILIIFA